MKFSSERSVSGGIDCPPPSRQHTSRPFARRQEIAPQCGGTKDRSEAYYQAPSDQATNEIDSTITATLELNAHRRGPSRDHLLAFAPTIDVTGPQGRRPGEDPGTARRRNTAAEHAHVAGDGDQRHPGSSRRALVPICRSGYAHPLYPPQVRRGRARQASRRGARVRALEALSRRSSSCSCAARLNRSPR